MRNVSCETNHNMRATATRKKKRQFVYSHSIDVTCPASYYRGTGLYSRPRDIHFVWDYCWFSSVFRAIMWHHKASYDYFLPHPFLYSQYLYNSMLLYITYTVGKACSVLRICALTRLSSLWFILFHIRFFIHSHYIIQCYCIYIIRLESIFCFTYLHTDTSLFIVVYFDSFQVSTSSAFKLLFTLSDTAPMWEK